MYILAYLPKEIHASVTFDRFCIINDNIILYMFACEYKRIGLNELSYILAKSILSRGVVKILKWVEANPKY